MQRKQNALAGLVKLGVCAAIAFSAIAVQAQGKVDVSGNWKWTGPARGQNPGPEITAKLKQDGGKVTGSLMMPARGGGDPTEVPISDGMIKGDALSFNVVRDNNGTSITNSYEGKVAGDTIKGTQPAGRGGRRGGAAAADGAAPTPPPRPEWTATKVK